MNSDQKQPSKFDGAAESAGGGYPNPHTGKEPDKGFPDPLGHGGQTEQKYYGSGQQGDRRFDDEETQNSPAGS